MFEKSFITPQKLPLVLQPKKKNLSLEEFLEGLEKENDFIQKSLLEYGGILFRNFPLSHVDHFALVLERMKTGKCVDYIGGDSPRNKIKGQIYTSTEAPPSIKIPLHNELSFVKNYPSHIYFFCEIASEEGGATILGNCRNILKSMDPGVLQRFKEKGLKYYSRYYYKKGMISLIKSHKTWINVFETEDKEKVERLCRENEFGFTWNKNDWLEITQKRPAIMQHPKTHEEVWFNQAHLYDFNPKLLGKFNYVGAKLVYWRDYTRLHDVFYGDDTPIPRKDLYHVLDVLDQNTIAFPWQKGDLLALDNVLTMHGRATFKGKRRILTAMTR